MEAGKMPKVIAELKVLPMGSATPSVSKHVAKALKALQEMPVKITIGSGFTTIEGELSEVLKAVEKAHNAVFSDEIKRVNTVLVIDDRRDKELTPEGKLKSVMEKLHYME
jgi:uncharacterized protein (TIGR00106 family)